MARPKIGELLVQAKALTREQLDEELKAQEGSPKRIGEILLERGLITEAQLTQALSLQLSIPWVSLYHVDFSRQLLNRLPQDVAEKFCLIPIFVRHVKGQGETLYVATDDPQNETALAEAARHAALPVKPMIAARADIKSAIRVYYGGGSPNESGEVPVQPAATVPEPRPAPPAPPPPPPPRSVGEQRTAEPSPPEAAPRPAAPPPPPSVSSNTVAAPVSPPLDKPKPAKPSNDSPNESPEIEASEISVRVPPSSQMPVPSPAQAGAAALSKLTFLDGTAIALPSRTKSTRPGSTPPAEQITARDLISALRAMARGVDASDILGENPRMESMFAALLSLMLKRGLIADWEFVEEYKKG